MPAKGQRSGHTCNCENCGKKIYQTNTQYNRAKHHFCSNKYQKEFQHKKLFEMRKCPICGLSFETSKKSKQKFCSLKCQGEWQSQQIGILNPRFTQQKIPCEYCGKEFYTKQYKLRKEIKALSGVDIMKNKDEFKSTYDILDELSNKWSDLTDIQRASVTELIAGELKFAGVCRNTYYRKYLIARVA